MSDSRDASRRRRPTAEPRALPELRRALAAARRSCPGRLRCVNCLSRFELVSQCPNCGEHQTIARMSHTEDMQCQSCGASMLQAA